MIPLVHKLESLRRHISRSGGYSLIELLVAMLLLGVILAAIFGIWFGLQRSYAFTDDDFTAQEQARAAMSEMVELIRTARLPEPPPAAANLRLVVLRAEPNLIVCWTDQDRDAAHQLELVRFRVDESARTLYRDTDTEHTNDLTFASSTSQRLVGRWLSNDGDSPLFTYKGANGAALEMATDAVTGHLYVIDPNLIREVHINLLVDVIKDKAPIRHELSSVVQPRNMRQF